MTPRLLLWEGGPGPPGPLRLIVLYFCDNTRHLPCAFCSYFPVVSNVCVSSSPTYTTYFKVLRRNRRTQSWKQIAFLGCELFLFVPYCCFCCRAAAIAQAPSRCASREGFKKTVSDTPLRLSLLGNVTLFDKRSAMALRAATKFTSK
jgi:hypothetical protein